MMSDTGRLSDDTELLSLMGSNFLLTQDGKFSIAKENLDKYIEKQASLHGKKSLEYIRGQFSLALFSKMAKEHTVGSKAWLEIGKAMDENEELNEVFQEGSSVELSLPMVFIQLALESLYEGRDFRSALAMMKENENLFKRYKGEPSVDLDLAYIYLKLGMSESASERFDSFLRKPKSEKEEAFPKALNRVARSFLAGSNPDFQRALQASQLASKRSQNDSIQKELYLRALNNRAFCEFHLNKKLESKAHFSEWSALVPNDFESNPAALALEFGQYESSVGIEGEDLSLREDAECFGKKPLVVRSLGLT